MPNPPVCPSVPVKRNRAKNMESDRLVRRRARLAEMFARAGDFEWSRMEFAWRAYEMQAIENALVSRGEVVSEDRYSVPGNAA